MLRSSALLIILTAAVLVPVMPQEFHTKSSRAVRAYSEARQQYDFLYYDKAEKLLREALSYDKNFYEAHLLLGDLYAARGKYADAAKFYREAVRIDSLFNKPLYFHLARSEMMSGDYRNALRHFKLYLEFRTGNEKNSETARKSILDCEFALKAINDPVPFEPVSVGENVNTANDEYWPSITADGLTLMFTRQNIIQGTSRKGDEDFYISRLTDGKWSKAVNAGTPLNTPQNEGAQSISSDGTYMFFTACDRPGGFGRCDIWYSFFDGSRWSEGRNVGPPVNTNYWESQPSVSANGRVLFFTSNRPGGKGGMDIWFSVKEADGRWKIPVNMGDYINTSGDEMSPFIHFDGSTLYYSSNGLPGMGSYDIFMTRMNKDSVWSKPQNLGYPINSVNDELGLIIDSEGSTGYFSTIRKQGGGKDLYSFRLADRIKPDPVSYFRGRVYDSQSMKMLKSEYELIDLSTGIVIESGSTDMYGSFLVCLPTGNNYALNVSKKGYLFFSDNFMFEGIHTVARPFNKRILLNPVTIGGSLQLTNVFFRIDSWEIRKESDAELERLARLLRDNPGIVVEVGGYTDSTGTAEHNLTLSERRAKAVVDWLAVKGIEKGRLVSKGYGAASPVGNNVTDEGRRLNRRTEVKVIGVKK